MMKKVKRESTRVKRERSDTDAASDNGTGDDSEVSFVRSKRARLPTTIGEDGMETVDLT